MGTLGHVFDAKHVSSLAVALATGHSPASEAQMETRLRTAVTEPAVLRHGVEVAGVKPRMEALRL